MGHCQLPDGKLPGGVVYLKHYEQKKCCFTYFKVTLPLHPSVHWQKNLWNTYMRPEGKKTVGSMDLGGASTQIAFAIEDDLNGPDYMHIKLYGYPYNVYTHSFLCYGKNEAEKKVLDKVLQVHTLHLVFVSQLTELVHI